MTITETLAMEHRGFLTLFDQIEAGLPNLQELEELKFLANLVKGDLRRHGELERNLVFPALDHVLADRGQVQRLHQDHRELDAQLSQVNKAPNLEAARGQLRAILRAVRTHFREEEANVFPLLEAVLREETLSALAGAWQEQTQLAAKPIAPLRKTRKDQVIEDHVGTAKNATTYFGGAMLAT